VVLIALEAETQRMGHRVVQAVEAFVQPVMAEVVAEMTDLDMSSECRRRSCLDPVPEGVEQPVFGARFMAQLLTTQTHIVSLGFVRPEPKSMVVLTVLRIVHSHDVHGPPVEPACPDLQRPRPAEEFLEWRISSGTHSAASMEPWKR
jgi:hypothetical protein